MSNLFLYTLFTNILKWLINLARAKWELIINNSEGLLFTRIGSAWKHPDYLGTQLDTTCCYVISQMIHQDRIAIQLSQIGFRHKSVIFIVHFVGMWTFELYCHVSDLVKIKAGRWCRVVSCYSNHPVCWRLLVRTSVREDTCISMSKLTPLLRRLQYYSVSIFTC